MDEITKLFWIVILLLFTAVFVVVWAYNVWLKWRKERAANAPPDEKNDEKKEMF